jgi:nitroreductase
MQSQRSVQPQQDGKSLSVRDAVTGRRSVRRFLNQPVAIETVRQILADASRSPSGTNSQPWLVHVVTGAARDRVCKDVTAAAIAGHAQQEYPYFPDDAGEPYLSRRRKVGFDLYALYGVDRKDIEGRKRAMLMNFDFFGAPVGLFFAMEKKMLYGSWLDLGMFLQSVMVLARGHGLETCPQEAWGHYGPTVHKSVGIPDDHVIVSGMALGIEDKTAKANTLVTEREAVDGFTTFHT